MSGLKTNLAAFALLGAMSVSAQAQGVVPGGWSSQFGYQPLGGTNFMAGSEFGSGSVAPGFGGGGISYGGFGAYPTAGSPAGLGQWNGSSASAVPPSGYPNGPFPGLTRGMPQTSVGTDPLIGAISKSVRRSKRR